MTLDVVDILGERHVYEDIALRDECPFKGPVETHIIYPAWTCPLCGTEHEMEE